MKKLLLILLVTACVHKPPVTNGPVPTCDVVCNHIQNQLKCQPGLETVNQRGCMVICDNLFESAENAILNCWIAATSCAQLDTCDQ